VELQARYAELRSLGLGLAAFTYDAPDVIQKFTTERQIAFPILSDQGGAVVTRYGILNQQYEPGHQNYGIPHPGTFILARGGRVVARYFEGEYQYRNTTASIALKLGTPVPGTGVPINRSTSRVEIAAFLSDESVAPGHRFSIVVDITPAPGTGVVAPGDHSYRVIELKVGPAEKVRTYAVDYPASEHLMAPQDERVPAYMQPFRLLQDVAVLVNADMRQLAASPGASVTLEARLEYQVCSDEGCDPPEEVPLMWTLALKPL
jgi:hypothetical protein